MPDGGSVYVGRSPDFDRIVSLPRRVFTWEQAERDARELTPELVTPLGKKAGVTLRPLQGFVLQELWKHRGCYFSGSVGAGKTLTSFLAPYVMNAERPVLVVPDNLIEKTQFEFSEYAKHWVSPQRPQRPARLVGYKELSRKTADELIERLKADFWIFDEVDVLANQEGAATRRVAADISARGVPVLAMTGTDGRFSIKDFSHFLTWALKDGAPVPLVYSELERWAAALDERKPGMNGMLDTLLPGVLLELIDEGLEASLLGAGWLQGDIDRVMAELTTLGRARMLFQRRMAETPGVIMLDDDDCNQPLTIRHFCAPESEALNAHFVLLKTANTTPDYEDPRDGAPMQGHELMGPLEKMQKEDEIGCDFHNVWVPPPPEEWRDARRTFARFVRNRIEWSNTEDKPKGWRGAWPLYTELMVKEAYPHHAAVAAWRAIEPTFTPNSVPMWLGGSVVGAAAEWALEAPGLVWVPHVPVGEAIAQLTGLPYYGAKGLTAGGSSIVRIDPSKSAIVSVASNLRGRNLQMFCRNLIIGCRPSAKFFEQLVGRTHRYGQLNPVLVEIMLTSGLSNYSFDMLLKEAKFVLSVRGKTQKVLRADIERTTFPSDALRWAYNKRANGKAEYGIQG
jgi:hypothetical protein